MSSAHLSLGLNRELWNELLSAALPVKLAGGQVDVIGAARGAVRQLGVRQRVAGLLEDRRTPSPVRALGGRARELWRDRRGRLLERVEQVVQVEGTWRVELDQLGTELRYGRQRIDADAYARAVLEGKIWLLQENLEIPFTLERRFGASVALADVRYDRGRRAVVGSLRDVGVYMGEGAALQLVSRLVEALLEQQTPRVNPITLIERERVAEMVAPMGGPLSMQMGVEDLNLVIDEDDLRLEIRFGFSRAQLTEEAPV